MVTTASRHQRWSRRGFMAALATFAAGCGLATKPAEKSSALTTTLREWKSQFPGKVVTSADSNYELWRSSMPWQMFTAKRRPDLIVRPDSSAGVVDAVNYARTNKLRIAVKSGGHNVCEAFLRDNGMLLDLGELQGITVDREAQTAWVEPALWSHGMMQAIEPHGLAFPVAHCATVPMGGYLLGGGVGLNGSEWGSIACHNILAAEIVTANGEKVIASAEQNADLYWAVRGAGTGFFGVVTRYLLRLYPLPKQIYESVYVFPLAQLQQVSRCIQEVAATGIRKTELMMLFAHNPGAPADAAPAASKICIARAVAYADSKAEAGRLLQPLMNHKCIKNALMKNELTATSFNKMAVESVDASQGLGFGRYAVDTIWTDSPDEALESLAEHFSNARSKKTHLLASFLCNAQLRDDAAFSKIGSAFVGSYCVWDNERHDTENFAWLRRAAELMRPHSVGQYISEVDAFHDPSVLTGCFSEPAWQRMRELRAKHDPDGVFHDFHGLSEQV